MTQSNLSKKEIEEIEEIDNCINKGKEIVKEIKSERRILKIFWSIVAILIILYILGLIYIG